MTAFSFKLIAREIIALLKVAAEYLSGRELTEPLVNNLEVTIRAYDPCLSYAAQALGKMPLQLDLSKSDTITEPFNGSQNPTQPLR